MSLEDTLSDATFEIAGELIARKILERHTDWKFEFRKGGTFDYDLVVYRWSDEATRPDDSEPVGYIEIERASGWVSGEIPDNWVFLSFLERKVRAYDYRLREWTGTKSNIDESIYLKFSHEMDNCFAVPIASIDRDGSQTPRSDGTPTNTYRSLPIDHPDVRYGIDDSTAFIRRFFSAT